MRGCPAVSAPRASRRRAAPVVLATSENVFVLRARPPIRVAARQRPVRQAGWPVSGRARKPPGCTVRAGRPDQVLIKGGPGKAAVLEAGGVSEAAGRNRESGRGETSTVPKRVGPMVEPAQGTADCNSLNSRFPRNLTTLSPCCGWQAESCDPIFPARSRTVQGAARVVAGLESVCA